MRPATLAWVLFALAALLSPVAPLLRLAGNETPLVFLLVFAAVQLSMAGAGAFVASRLPSHRIGWLLLAIGLGLGLKQAIGAYGELGNTTASGPLPADDVAAWLAGWPFLPIVVGGVVFLLHLFPDGQFMSRRWRLVGLASGAAIAVTTVADALKPGRLDSVESVENPVGAGGALADVVVAVNALSGPIAILVFGLAAGGMGVRVRRAVGVERQQIKWIAFVLALVIVFLAGSAGLDLAGDGDHPMTWISLLLALVALASLPLAAGVAILRYRLYDIDVAINRALVYGALTATLAATYLGSVLLLQLALAGLAGDSGLAVAASTLAVAALFRPARSRIQQGVDRRFYRRKYDAHRTLEAFGARLRDEVDLDTLAAELRTVVGDTMQPGHVSLWLREVGR